MKDSAVFLSSFTVSTYYSFTCIVTVPQLLVLVLRFPAYSLRQNVKCACQVININDNMVMKDYAIKKAIF